jgi:sulfite reductase (NADPH) flavoprotein alpha-component
VRSLTATTIALALLGSSAHGAWFEALPPDPHRIVAAAVVASCYVVFVSLVMMRHASRRGRAAAAASVGHDNAPMLVAYASQTGYAEELARTTSKALQQSNIPARVLSFSDLDAAALARAQTALFIVSTTGEGDPPDPAARFIRTVMSSGVELTGLRYGVLALGDRSFARFCAFGDAVDDWLATRSGTRMFDAIRVHNGDPAALGAWWRRVEDIVGAPVAVPEPAPAGAPWRLIARAPANPGNPEHAAHYVSLAPMGPLPDWKPGDVAIIRPHNDPAEVSQLLQRVGLDGELQLDGDGGMRPLAEHLSRSALPQTPEETAALARLSPALLAKSLTPLPVCEYSPASLPADKRIDLLIRQSRRPDGRLGLASGWLTTHAPLGGAIEVSVRANAAFHPPENERPMILIGNGTGIAGLRVHLKARAAAGAMRNWLIFGERSAANDFFYRDDIDKWRWGRVLERVDFAFSRDQAQRRYVQDIVGARGDDIRTWVEAGAAIYVCGSLRGMSTAVTEALTGILGAETLERMIERRLYCRDVY